jgi:Phosphotransferase enzyme family
MSDFRNKLLWMGDPPAADGLSACEGRKLLFTSVGAAPSLPQLKQAKGLIVAIRAGATASVLDDQLQDTLRLAVHHGLKASITCSYDDVPAVGLALKAWRLNRSIEAGLHGQESELIEKIARARLEPAFNESLKIEGAGELSVEESILLGRSFGDCVSVRLVRQTTGSAKVYCAFANLRDSRAGPLPLPFFVKFGRAQAVETELTNYKECTTLYIPFNQRPNLDHDRCLIGHERGIVVGNFVEQSEALQSAIDRGAGRTALHSLFDGALRGWRRQAFYDDTRYVSRGNLLDRLRLTCPSSYKPARRNTLRLRQSFLGRNYLSHEELEAMLRAMPAVQYRWGLTHGDLHGQNIRISGSDAILIDFASIAHGPLTTDPAALDVSLVMDTEVVSGDAWKELADNAFKLSSLKAPIAPPRPENPCANLLDALHYIRQTAFETQFDWIEYPTVVALQLLRKASYQNADSEHEARRRHAYALAHGLIKEMSSASLSPIETSAA